MNRQMIGFKRLLMSTNVARNDHARRVLSLAREGSLSVHYELEEDIDRHEWAKRAGTLIAKMRPESGWLSRAEHGTLAVRENEYYLHPIIGCRSACTYCYLMGRPHGRAPLRLHLGIEELITAIEREVSSADGKTLRFCTGELADSLADSQLWPVAALLTARFSRGDLGVLELRTKSDQIRSVLTAPHNGFTVVGFSIAPESYVLRHEPATATLRKRLLAASALSQVGYRIALKCEPIIPEDDWEANYRQMFMAAVQCIPTAAIDHVSVGCLRWSSSLAAHPLFARKYKGSIIESAQVEYRPGRFNGTLPMRRRLLVYREIRQMIVEAGITAPIWWSLEEPDLIQKLA